MYLSIILVNYNNTSDTISCIKSLNKQKFRDFEIVIVENNSNDEEKENLHNFLSSKNWNNIFVNKVKIIESSKNLGYTGGNNIAIKHAHGDLILLLNSDTFHNSDFLDIMVSFFKNNPKIHIAQPKICFYPNKEIIWGLGGKVNKYSYNLFSHLKYKQMDDMKITRPFRINYAIGCALFIRRKILKRIGLLDIDYFMYGEESDLCYRAILNGFNNIYCNPKSIIYHNVQVDFTEMYKKYCFRNRIIFCIKFFNFPLIIWQFLMQFIQLMLYCIKTQDKHFDYLFFFKSIKGFIDGFKIGFRKRIKGRLH